ncbi:MAG: stage II sporulation protein M [Nitrososphaerales archaeon]
MSRRRRLAFVGIAAAVFASIYSVGASVDLREDDARELKDEFMKQVEDIDAIGIFLNNFRIAAAMFIPAFGVVVGVISAYSTGMVFNALAQTTPELAGIHPLAILSTPFGLMEMFSYGVAMSQSAILINVIVRKQKIKPMLIPTLILLGIVAGVLFASAFIEFYMIEAVTQQVGPLETI